jgi:hypothetical protein
LAEGKPAPVHLLDENTMLQHREDLKKYDFYCAVPVVKPKGERVIVRKLTPGV